MKPAAYGVSPLQYQNPSERWVPEKAKLSPDFTGDPVTPYSQRPNYGCHR